ncbi:MAG: hypothetical protein WAM91_00220 [Candidatus Acidiferrales bacterium]
MANTEPMALTGSCGAYLWLATEQHDIQNLLQRCPQAFLRKYVAVTSHDSGPLILTDDEKHAGWQNRNDIAYSPPIQSVDRLPCGKCAGFDEWYVFESPSELGQLSHGNVFEAPITPGQVFTFVNFLGFGMHNSDVKELVSLFWKQIDWIQPESYIADGDPFLTFVSSNKNLFTAVREALTGSAPRS